MNTGKRSNVLLVELLIVIFFFMIGSVILMQVFEKTYTQSRKAEAGTNALALGQSYADRLYQAEEEESTLEELGFTEAETDADTGYAFFWTREDGDITYSYGFDRIGADGGVIRKGTLSAAYKGEELFTLPCTKYLGGDRSGE